MFVVNFTRVVFRFLSSAATLAVLLFVTQVGFAAGRTGDVYVLSNQQTGNSVIVFHRDADGRLSYVESVPTGGNGAGTGGDPLASQGAVVLSADNRLLFAVNAGSDSVSEFSVSGDRLKLIGTVSSGGSFPVSLTVRDDLLYVLNAGATPNISGFTIKSATDELVPLAGSTQDLPGGQSANPAQVSFTPDGSVLVVTEKGTNQIDTFTVDDDGTAEPAVAYVRNGGNGTVSGFRVQADGSLVPVELIGGLPAGTQGIAALMLKPGAFFKTAAAQGGRPLRAVPEGGL